MDIENYSILSFSIIKNSFTNVTKSLKDILGKDWVVALGGKEFDLNEVYIDRPPKGANFDIKILLWRPLSNPDSTIFCCNLSDGWQTLIYKYHKETQSEIIRTIIPNKNIVSYYTCDFEYLHKDMRRRIGLSYDINDGFDFFQSGNPVWFENVSYYKKRNKKDRINKDIILEYLNALNYEIDNNFWKSTELSFFIKGQNAI